MHRIGLLVEAQVALANAELLGDLLLELGLRLVVLHLELIQKREGGRVAKVQLPDHLLRLAQLCDPQILLLLVQALSGLLVRTVAPQVFTLPVDLTAHGLGPVDILSLAHEVFHVTVAQLLKLGLLSLPGLDQVEGAF